RLSFWRYVGWLLSSSSLASRRACGGLTRCSFAARLRCHCSSLKISLMAQASSNGATSVYDFLPVHCIIDFARLCFVDRENIYQILHISIAQSFQISKAGFYQGKRLFFGNGERAGQRLCGLSHLLFHDCRRCRVLAYVDFPAGEARSEPRVLSFFPDRERKLILIDGDLYVLFLCVENQIFYFRRFERFQNVFLWIRAPADDIHLFVVELAHNVF